ncbi:MAG: hypothetical protein KAK00_03185 [Nanoarchaeota archaeon]|nr:hypothetical protein [Nanoarchaeota archaeon]
MDREEILRRIRNNLLFSLPITIFWILFFAGEGNEWTKGIWTLMTFSWAYIAYCLGASLEKKGKEAREEIISVIITAVILIMIYTLVLNLNEKELRKEKKAVREEVDVSYVLID